MDKQWIIKANGEKAPYDSRKIVQSLLKSGATPEQAMKIAQHIDAFVEDEMSTQEIYEMAFSLLKTEASSTAARYKLKKAIMELGETGYPFEYFISSILAKEGFTTQTGRIVNGKCVTHEIDVIAQDEHHHYMCECKFHNQQGRYCSIKIPLYIQSRFKDVEQVWQKQEGHAFKIHQGWIFTNTRFSLDAMTYGKCVGLQLISWDYPTGGSLKDRIDRTGIYPITSLTLLTKQEKTKLIQKNIVTCLDLCASPALLQNIGIGKPRAQKIQEEANVLCNPQSS